jgi:serine/threonine protein kinase
VLCHCSCTLSAAMTAPMECVLPEASQISSAASTITTPINYLVHATFQPKAHRPRPQDVVIKETAVMAGMRHPNVLPLLAAFVEGGSLWMVLPFYAAGSLLSIIQYRHPEVTNLSQCSDAGGHAVTSLVFCSLASQSCH